MKYLEILVNASQYWLVFFILVMKSPTVLHPQKEIFLRVYWSELRLYNYTFQYLILIRIIVGK